MVIVEEPEPKQGSGQAQAHLYRLSVLLVFFLSMVAPGEAPGERSAQVVVLALQEVEPAQRIGADKLPIGALSQRQVVGGVPAPAERRLTGCQVLPSKLP